MVKGTILLKAMSVWCSSAFLGKTYSYLSTALLTGTNLYCLMTEARVCVQLAKAVT